MSYQLKARETFSAGVKRIAAEELGEAIKGLRGGVAEGEGGTVHDVRKRFKKLRAVLRLVRSDLGGKGYREANALLRDAGRELSGLRDAQVLVKTLEALAEHFPDKAHQQAFVKARKTLRSRQQLAEAQEEVLASDVAAKVATLEAQIDHWHIGDTWGSVEPNLSRAYGRGLEAFKNAYRRPSDESFHEWRKGVKDLWYHLRILNPLWPEVLDEFAAQASRLADLLGSEHDLAVLSQKLAAEPRAFGSAKQVEALLKLVDGRREEIRSDARLLGLRLYADKPKLFSKRFGAYWQTWQKGKRTAQVQGLDLNHAPSSRGAS